MGVISTGGGVHVPFSCTVCCFDLIYKGVLKHTEICVSYSVTHNNLATLLLANDQQVFITSCCFFSVFFLYRNEYLLLVKLI